MGAGMAEFCQRPVVTVADYNLYCHYVAVCFYQQSAVNPLTQTTGIGWNWAQQPFCGFRS